MKLLPSLLISAAIAAASFSGAAFAATEDEPVGTSGVNDTLAQAQSLGTLNANSTLSVSGYLEYSSISGLSPDFSIVPGSPLDYYSFNLATQGLVSVSVFTPHGATMGCCSDQDPLFAVYNASGTLLFANDDISSDNKNAFASSDLTVGQYFVRVTDGHTSGWPYTLEITHTAAAVPEPETYAMMLAGLGALGWVARRRKSA